jgi:hypothetical protein
VLKIVHDVELRRSNKETCTHRAPALCHCFQSSRASAWFWLAQAALPQTTRLYELKLALSKFQRSRQFRTEAPMPQAHQDSSWYPHNSPIFARLKRREAATEAKTSNIPKLVPGRRAAQSRCQRCGSSPSRDCCASCSGSLTWYKYIQG